MTSTPKCIVQATYATASDVTVYTAPVGTNTIIDKFTAANQDGSSHTLNVNLVPNGGSVGAGNLLIDAQSVSGSSVTDFSGYLQNQILNAGDFLSIKASAASDILVRVSGREVTIP